MLRKIGEKKIFFRPVGNNDDLTVSEFEDSEINEPHVEIPSEAEVINVNDNDTVDVTEGR